MPTEAVPIEPVGNISEQGTNNNGAASAPGVANVGETGMVEPNNLPENQ